MQPLSSLQTVLNCHVFLNNNNSIDVTITTGEQMAVADWPNIHCTLNL